MTTAPMSIRQALTALDPTNDEHWTNDGSPRMDAVERLVGTKSITRRDVVDAAPMFNRTNPVVPDHEPQPAPAAEPEAAPQADPLRAKKAELEAELAAQQAQWEDMRKRLANTQRELDNVILELTAGQSKQSSKENTHAIRDYLDTQAAIRRAKSDRLRDVKAQLSGDFAHGLTVKAPIDAAMARRTARGTQRPPVIGQPPKRD